MLGVAYIYIYISVDIIYYVDEKQDKTYHVESRDRLTSTSVDALFIGEN